ncbi:hypothetical protein [Breoghania sp.]|uniref:hypothetical protein n=1 Tax=Breoghania sp. TaxID=2065378 RepID=UPI002AA7C634|nr:hypothetical protein [Breoghania sp.]
MSAEIQSGDFARASAQAVHEEVPGDVSWTALREALDRPDLDDDVLSAAIGEAIDHAIRLHTEEDRSHLIAQLAAGDLEDRLPRAVVACLCLPARRAPLAMPVQVLQREHTPVFARLFSRIRARQG